MWQKLVEMLKYKNVGKIRMQKTEEEKEAERS